MRTHAQNPIWCNFYPQFTYKETKAWGLMRVRPRKHVRLSAWPLLKFSALDASVTSPRKPGGHRDWECWVWDLNPHGFRHTTNLRIARRVLMLIRNDLTPYIHYLLAINLKFSEPDATSVKKTWHLPKCCLLTMEYENISQKAWPPRPTQ